MPKKIFNVPIACAIVLLLVLSSNVPTVKSAPAVVELDQNWTVDDVVATEWASDWDNWRISPDCKWAVWLKKTPDRDRDDWPATMYLSSLTKKKEIQLTRGTEGAENPKWSPDSQLIAFFSSRSESKGSGESKNRRQIWLINPDGGEPWPLTSGDRAIRNFDWANTHTIIYSAQEDASLYEELSRDKKGSAQVVEDEAHKVPVRLFKIDVSSKKTIRITDNDDEIGEFAVSPDGTQVVSVHNRSLRNTYDRSLQPLTFLTTLKTGEKKEIFEKIKFPPWHLRWQRDSRGIFAVSANTTSSRYDYPAALELDHYDVLTGKSQKVDLNWENGLASELFEVTDNGFIAPLANGVRPRYARYWRDGDGWRREWLSGIHTTNIFACQIGSDDKTLLYDHSDPRHVSQWFCATLNGARIESPTQLTRLNPQLQNMQTAEYEIVHWPGALGETTEGLLFYPFDYQPGKKYPLVVEIHGGPAWLFDERWQLWLYNQNLLNARGMFVFRPNYHGSAGYGLKWLESNLDRLNELETEDINKGVDYLIDRNLVDPDKLAVMGWSNGGTLVASVTVRTNRYKAAIAGDGPIEWTDYWAKSDFGAWFCGSYFGKNPLEDPARLMKSSSLYEMGKITTPTLIFFGADDFRVPVDQGWMYYRALQQTGKTDVRFVLFNGETHGPAKFANARRTLEEELSWFDNYLFQKVPESVELEPQSPLSMAIKLKKAKADGIHYGAIQNGVLIPETVRYKGLRVGRFEITRAQFAAFDRNYLVPPTRDNFPANGIVFDQAKAYCEWLSKITGDNYRLPNSSEAALLYDDPRDNTLDYWIGKPVNPDDAKKVQTKIHELEGDAPLLKEVGSFPGQGTDDPVFDLGGNVAEWTAAGTASGGSADIPADKKMPTRNTAPEYIGFRVVKDEPVERSNQ